MARPLRIEYENAVYHVMNRGRSRQTIFHDTQYYLAFEQCLYEAHQRFGVEILAYCLMGNHYHLLIKTPRGNLSRAMRHINGLYTQRYNRLKSTDGPLFRGRYKGILVDTSSYLLQVSRYIHRNPVETKKPLVTKLEKYRWSSYPAYINKASVPSWLQRDDVYGELGSGQRYKAYQLFVDQGNDAETLKFYAKKNTPGIWGDKAFVKKALKKALSGSKEVTTTTVLEPIEMSRIVEQVAQYYEMSEDSIYTAQRGRGVKNVPRWIAMKLCRDYSGKSLSEIGEAFGVSNYCTVSQTITRLVVLMQEDKKVEKVFNTISKDLTP